MSSAKSSVKFPAIVMQGMKIDDYELSAKIQPMEWHGSFADTMRKIKPQINISKWFRLTRVANDLEHTTKKEVETCLQNIEEAYVRFQAIAEQLITIISEEEHQ